MSIVKMKHITLIAENKDKDTILNRLMWLGSVDITPLSEVCDDELRCLTQADGDADMSARFDEKKQSLTEVIDLISPYVTKKRSLFSKPNEIAKSRFDSFEEDSRELFSDVRYLLDKKKELAQLRANENRMTQLVASLESWRGLDLEFNKPISKHVVYELGFIPATVDIEPALAELYENAPCHVELFGGGSEQRCAAVFYCKKDEQAVNSALSIVKFSGTSFKDLVGTPEENIAIATEKIEQIHDRRDHLEQKLRKYAERIGEFEEAYDILSNNEKITTFKNSLLKTNSTFLLEGWCPEKRTDKLESLSEELGFYMEIRDAEEGEEPPVLLKNNAFASQFEPIVKMYALPVYRGLDPTFMMSPFFFMFFGLMLGDAGYGALISLACGVALIFGHFKEGMKKNIRMFFLCGLSTVFWGVVFGSYFGDVIPVFSEAFTGVKSNLAPLWFSPLDEPLLLLVFSFAIGYVHIMVGICMKGFVLIRDGKIVEMLCDVLTWVLVLLGLPVWGIASILGTLPSWVATAGLVMLLVGAAGLILTQGRDKKNPLLRLGSGIMSLYDITSYLSDVLSYSRILALGLSTSVIGGVFNKLSVLFVGDGVMGKIVGFVAFLVIFFIGTLLNIAISTLGTYVHTSRLQFIEFFGKFYESGGREFDAMRVETKYSEIKE